MQTPADLARKTIFPDRLKRFIDVNTDFGQTRDLSFFEKSEYQLLNHVSSVNIPCCVHDGDPKTTLAMMAKAKEYNCEIGAHIGYPDPANNGYKALDMDAETLAAWIYVQLGTFRTLAQVLGIPVGHVRPHGALYNAFYDQPETALAVAEAIYKVDPWLYLMAPVSPVTEEVAQKTGIRIAPELVLGKRYQLKGDVLVPNPDDVLQPQGIHEQARQMILNGQIVLGNGKNQPVQFRSLHLSPTMFEVTTTAERVTQLLGQPVALTLADLGASGWLGDSNEC